MRINAPPFRLGSESQRRSAWAIVAPPLKLPAFTAATYSPTVIPLVYRANRWALGEGPSARTSFGFFSTRRVITAVSANFARATRAFGAESCVCVSAFSGFVTTGSPPTAASETGLDLRCFAMTISFSWQWRACVVLPVHGVKHKLNHFSKQFIFYYKLVMIGIRSRGISH